VRKFSAVRITAIHLCHRQLRFVTMKPQIRGPRVLPPAIAFLGFGQRPRTITDVSEIPGFEGQGKGVGTRMQEGAPTCRAPSCYLAHARSTGPRQCLSQHIPNTGRQHPAIQTSSLQESVLCETSPLRERYLSLFLCP
jgi:hypothetical protein